MRELLGRLQLSRHLLGLGEIGLGENEDLWRSGMVNMRANPLVASADGLGAINKHRHHVNVGKLAQGGAVQLLAKSILRLMEARGIHYHDLAIRRVDNGAKALARGLRDGTGDGEPLAHAGVEQSGLAGIGAADERNEAATNWFVLRHGNHSLEELLDCGGPKNDKPRNTDKQA